MTRAGRLAAPQGDEERLYRDHHRRLVSSVGWAVQADPALIEDACAHAWEQLIRHQPQRTERIFAWLRTVAIREAWALARREQREAGRGDDDSRELAESQPAPLDVDGALETRRALEALAALRDRERRYLALKTAGYSYKEIADRCGVTYTNVNKHLTRARARLRAPAAQAPRTASRRRRHREEVSLMAIGNCRTNGCDNPRRVRRGLVEPLCEQC